MATPEPAEKRLQRVLRVARADGWSLVGFAAPSAVLAVILGDTPAALAATGVVLCGLMELNGRAHLLRRSFPGIHWLWTAQLSCLVCILGYCVAIGLAANATHTLRMLPRFTREQLEVLVENPADLELLLVGLQRIIAGALALGALLFQGGMALFYLRSRPAVATAVATPPPLAPSRP